MAATHRYRGQMQEPARDARTEGQGYLQATVDTVKGAASFVVESVKHVVGAAPKDNNATPVVEDVDPHAPISTGPRDGPASPDPQETSTADCTSFPLESAREADAAVLNNVTCAVVAEQSSLEGCAVGEGLEEHSENEPSMDAPAPPKPAAPTGIHKAVQDNDSTAEDGEWKVKKPETSQPKEPEPQGFVERAKENIRATEEKLMEDGQWLVGAQQDNRLGELVQPTADNIRGAITDAAANAILGPQDHKPEDDVHPAPKKEEKGFLAKWFGWCWCC